jgi:ribosomal protein L3
VLPKLCSFDVVGNGRQAGIMGIRSKTNSNELVIRTFVENEDIVLVIGQVVTAEDAVRQL